MLPLRFKTRLNSLLKLSAMSLMIAALSGCGDGSKEVASPPASKRTLPLVPSAPDQTITGIDVNQNGVRDEVEVQLSSKIVDDAVYANSLKKAKAYQGILINTTPTTRPDALVLATAIACTENAMIPNSEGDAYRDLTFNTTDRQEKFHKYLVALDGGFDAAELGACN